MSYPSVCTSEWIRFILFASHEFHACESIWECKYNGIYIGFITFMLKILFMRYRRLTLEELKELESEFTTFLVTQGIPAEEWEKMKEKEPEQCQGLIDIFSDIVFEKILGKVKYLEHREKRVIRIFRFGEEKVVMNGFQLEGESAIDFRKDQNSEQLMQLFRLSPGKLKFFSAEKKYTKERSLEIFQMLESGAQILKEDRLFHLIEQLKDMQKK